MLWRVKPWQSATEEELRDFYEGTPHTEAGDALQIRRRQCVACAKNNTEILIKRKKQRRWHLFHKAVEDKMFKYNLFFLSFPDTNTTMCVVTTVKMAFFYVYFLVIF